MRSVRRLLVLLLLGTGISCLPAPAGIPTTPVLPPVARPGLLFDAADVPAISARLGRAPYAGWWATTLSLANAAASGNPGSASLSEETRARWAKAAAFAYAIGANPSHLAASRSALLAVGTGPDTTIDDAGPNLGPVSRTVLTASSHLQAVAQAYDMLRPHLPSADLLAIEARIASAADDIAHWSIAADPNVTFLRINNWRTKACAALGTAALALPASTVGPFGGTPLSWLDRALRGVDQVYRRTLTSEGWNAEGAWYTTYSFGNLLPFLTAYRRASAQNLYPWFQKVAHHALLLRQPDGLQPAFEDSLPVALPWQVLASELAAPGLYQAAWLDVAAQTSVTNWANNDVKEVDSIVLHDDGIAAQPVSQPFFVDTASGVARIAAADAPSDTVAWINGAADYWDPWVGGGHSHPDPLGLVVWAQGGMLAVDAGYGPFGYGSAHAAFYDSADAHNVALLDGQAALQNAPATLRAQVDGATAGALASFEVGYGPLASPYGSPITPIPYPEGTVQRTLLVLDRRTVVVHDVVSALAPRTIALSWHGRGTRTVVTEGADVAEVIWSRARSPLPDARLRLYSVASEPVTVARASGWFSDAWTQEETQDYVRVERAATTALRTLTLLDLSSPSEGPLASSAVATSGGEGIAISDGTGDETVLAGDGTAPLSGGGVTASARLARVRREAGVLREAVIERGTSLEVDGVVRLSSSATVTAALSRDGLAARVVVGSVASGGATLSVAPGTTAPSQVRWNGAPVAWTLGGDGVTAIVSVPGSGRLEVDLAP